MKLLTTFYFILLVFFSCRGQYSGAQQKSDLLLYQVGDKEILEKLWVQYSNEQNSEIGDLMVKIAQSFLGTHYVPHTLETGADEKMVINLRELDCTTFAENVLAITRTIKSGSNEFDKFVNELEKIRYRNGKRNGYLSRLHYFSDWIYDNHAKGIVTDVSGEIAYIPYPNKVDFMSTHPESYQVLKANPELIEILKLHEKVISERKAWYIPKEQISGFESLLRNGDIVALTTSIAGLDVTHVGIVVWKDGRASMIHASSKEMKVVITNETLEEFIKNSKSTTGIMVARPL